MAQINFNLRIEEDLNDKLTSIAKLEGRSKNKQIEYILKKYVDNYKENNIQINQIQNSNATVNFNNKGE